MPAIPGLELVEEMLLDGHRVRLLFIRRGRARHFRLTVPSRQQACCSVPPGASLEDARRFVQRARDWLARQVASRPGQEPGQAPLVAGGEYWWHGRPERLRPDPGSGGLRLGDWTVANLPAAGDLRPALEDALRHPAEIELRNRTAELAARLGWEPPPVRVRPQRARWGSCSPRGTVSLNWRLIQIPPEVSDYVILHELAHLRHPGHTARFWEEVRRVCPGWAEAEAWLRRN
ncbi:MAG: M48 family metallopeptidase, partial [Verrucomicrobiota bacterium]